MGSETPSFLWRFIYTTATVPHRSVVFEGLKDRAPPALVL